MKNVSVVIPALNEESNIENLLKSIQLQENKYSKVVEIILVDNGSTDSTIEIANKYNSKILVIKNCTIANLRNCGARIATGEILIFVDADCVLEINVVDTVVKLLNDYNVAAVGPDGLIPYGKSTWVQDAWYFHSRKIYEKGSIFVDNLSSGFFAVRRNPFWDVDGFEKRLEIGEDSDISRKLISKGYGLLRSNHLKVYNSRNPKGIIEFVSREFWHGDSFKSILIHKKIDKLTIFFITNLFLFFICLIVAIFKHNFIGLYIVILSITFVSFFKAIIKVKSVNLVFFQLSLIYNLYIIARIVSLLKK